MGAADSVVLIQHTTTEILDKIANLPLNIWSPTGNADISRTIRQMIADGRAPLQRAVYDIFEGGCGFLRRGVGMRGHPLIHFSNVLCRFVSVKKLSSIRLTPLRHELCLLMNISPAASDANMSFGELPLHRADKRFDVSRARLRTATSVSRLTANPGLRRRVMRMCLMMMPVPGMHGFR
jgi:hypothetical protein